MRDEVQEALYRRWRDIFREKDGDAADTGMCWGIECGDGWAPLIDAVCSVIDSHARTGAHPIPAAKSIKQKAGTLRFQLGIGFHCEYCAGAIEMARRVSERIDEQTGAPSLSPTLAR